MAEIKTIEELIKMKEQIKEEREKVYEVEIPSRDMVMKYKKPTRGDILKASKLDSSDGDLKLIYDAVVEPDLKNKDLLNAYCKGKPPYMIIEELLEPIEIGEFSKLLISSAPNESVDEFVKKK